MINKAGREIPEEILKATGKKPFEGAYAYDNYEYKKAAPTVRALSDPKPVSYTHLTLPTIRLV